MKVSLFRLQKYKKFESNSQHFDDRKRQRYCCFDCKSTKNLRAIHNFYLCMATANMLFRLQKYKKFESNSQPSRIKDNSTFCCFDCKSTKNLRAIHNNKRWYCCCSEVVSTAKVQKIWEQFTTATPCLLPTISLFRLQKYKKFESNSQRSEASKAESEGCFDCKSTKNLRAIHNLTPVAMSSASVVSTAKVQKIWEQFTTERPPLLYRYTLFRLQKYKKFESNSQPQRCDTERSPCCFDCKSTKNLRAIHN